MHELVRFRDRQNLGLSGMEGVRWGCELLSHLHLKASQGGVGGEGRGGVCVTWYAPH